MSQALFVGKNTIFLEKVDSTQTFATELVAKTSPIEGTCVRTDYQSDGKGQIGRYWHSALGKNLLCSYILYPSFLSIDDAYYLNIISSLALVDLCNDMNIDAKIKWPNDIYVEHRKLAGILVQNILQGARIKTTIMGIGLNVNEIVFPEALPNPTSLQLLTGQEIELALLLHILSAKLEKYYQKLREGLYAEVWDSYHQYLYRKDEIGIFIKSDGSIFSGIIKGVKKSGHLIVQTADTLEYFDIKEIQFDLGI